MNFIQKEPRCLLFEITCRFPLRVIERFLPLDIAYKMAGTSASLQLTGNSINDLELSRVECMHNVRVPAGFAGKPIVEGTGHRSACVVWRLSALGPLSFLAFVLPFCLSHRTFKTAPLVVTSGTASNHATRFQSRACTSCMRVPQVETRALPERDDVIAPRGFPAHVRRPNHHLKHNRR